MPTLPCENGGGSLNNPNGTPNQIGTNNPALTTLVPQTACVGTWEISGLQDSLCRNNDQARQASYVAEVLNISGAPINVFKLLGIHEQGNGSLLASGRIIGSAAFPGYPITGVNVPLSAWRSIQSGASVVTSSAYVGIDFGIKLIPGVGSEYQPQKQNWTKVASLLITQANTPNEFARQVKVEIADGACVFAPPFLTGVGTGAISNLEVGLNATQGTVTVTAITSTTFNVFATLQDGSVIGLNSATVGIPFFSPFINFTITAGLIPFVGGDMFSIAVNYVWKRLGLFNLIQSPLPQTLNFQYPINVKAIRITPTLFTGTGSWEVSALDVLDSASTDINNIQDLFFNENRDRDYSLEPVLIKAQYSPTDSTTDLSKFGLSMVDQYSFTTSFASMIQLLGRPLVTGDIIEVIPELQYDHNLKPIRKFLEITDTGWAAEGFSTSWKPTVYRFMGQQALPSQETRDIFGTLDTAKYLVADSLAMDDIGEQLDITPLTQTEEVIKEAADKVPETGSDDQRSTVGAPAPYIKPPTNLKGQPPAAQHKGKQGIYIEDGLPPDGRPYGEGFTLPDVLTVLDGDYFRLYYPPETKIPPRLYRFSLVKNRWIFLETDRRGDYSSHKPSVRSILQSSTQQGLGKKTI